MDDKPANNAAAFADMLVTTTNRVLEQNAEIKSLRQQLAAAGIANDMLMGRAAKAEADLAECQSKWEHFENSVAEKSMQCLSLEKELAECQKDGKHYAHEYLIAKDALAECQRERDEYLRDLGAMKNWIADWHKKDAELATVTKERDELAALNARMLVEYEARMKERDELKQNIRDMHDYMHKRIDEALAKLGADKKGEVG